MEQSLREMTILVIDDEPALLHLLERTLSRAGARVLTANCGSDALQILDQEQVHLLLCDVHLGSNNSCSDLLPQCQSEHPELKIIVTSGGTDYPENYPFLAKPYSIRDLIRLALLTVPPCQPDHQTGVTAGV